MARQLDTTAIIALFVLILTDLFQVTLTQRSLYHWKHDLEHRIRSYEGHHRAIQAIIGSSIYAQSDSIRLGAPDVRITSNGNVRFSDLIIPNGALRLSPHIVEPTINILVKKTKSYAESKLNELSHIQNQLETITRQLDDPRQQFIYRGLPNAPQPHYNFTHLITGTRVFKQAQYMRLVEAPNVTLPHIGQVGVSRVIDDTYLRNTKMGVYDSQNRLFFEGRKTFWNTVFTQPLKSGCCDRLKPLHTSRMMLRSADQNILAPILIHSNGSQHAAAAPPPAIIRQLSTSQLVNRPIELSSRLVGRNYELNLLPPAAPPANLIRPPNLISTRLLGQAEILKALVFKSRVMIDEALLANSFFDNRLVIGISSSPGFAFDLAHNNYLLKYSLLPNNYSQPIQRVGGTVVLDTGASFYGGIRASSVNRVDDLAHFFDQSIVHTNRPTTIRGPIRFNALPSVFTGLSGRPQNLLMLQASHGLQVGLLNGMRIPQDLVLLPPPGSGQQAPPPGGHFLRPNDVIHVRGPRHFANRLVCAESLTVNGLVNGLEMPSGVIPLHSHDFVGTVGHSNLWFMDGITAHHMTIQSGQLDQINLRDVNGGAQSIILNSMSQKLTDGVTVIRAPLRVMNLHLISSPRQAGQLPAGGQLNGFRPQEVLELSGRQPYEGLLYGRKKFLAPVEAAECIFADINQVANWTNHLIRIDRPNTVQTVHTKLAFTRAPTANGSSLTIGRLNVDFLQETNPAHYQQNWNFSPEFYLLHQALMREHANYTGGRYRVLNQVRLVPPSGGGGLVNNIALGDVVRTDQPFRFADTFTMVGKVEVLNVLSADRILSNYPMDTLDLVQFDKFRIATLGNTRAPIRLNSLVLGHQNRASFVQGRLLNGLPFSEFVHSIMSLTRPQVLASQLAFDSAASFEAMVRTGSSLNGIKHFHQFASSLKDAKYLFEDGLQCNQVIIRT